MEKAVQKFLYLRKLSPTNFDLESSQNFLNKKAGKLSSTEFDLKSNSNFLNGRSRPEILKSSQTSPNEILFGIKLKISEWKRQAANSYISANSLQQNSI